MHKLCIITIICALSLSACTPGEQRNAVEELTTRWQQADLRIIDPPDSINPSEDIAAAYLRGAEQDWQLRIDLVDVDPESWPDLLVVLEPRLPMGIAQPAGHVNDIHGKWYFFLRASGNLTVEDAKGNEQTGVMLSMLRHPEMDSILISWQASTLAGSVRNPHILVCSLPPNAAYTSDCTGSFSAEGEPPKPIPVLLAFHNVMPAYTPAQALRRWDGAHTGPFGGRHGLFNLLRFVRNFKIPVLLADLKSANSVSALDFLGRLPFIIDLQQKGLLIAPEFMHSKFEAETGQWVVEVEPQTARAFRLPASQLSYLPGRDPSIEPAGYLFRKGRALVAIPGNEVLIEAAPAGFSAFIKRSILQSYFAERGQKPLILGGSLPDSAWGDPQAARAAFQYIHDHPWIKPVSGADLLSLPIDHRIDAVNGIMNTRGNETRSRGDFSNGDQADIPMSSPYWPSSPKLEDIRRHYDLYNRALEGVERWSVNPNEGNTCLPETGSSSPNICSISTQNVYAVFEREHGALIYGFVRKNDQLHQIIAPSFQLVPTLSNPDNWDAEKGLFADPEVLPGIFIEPFETSKTNVSDQGISFTADGIELTYHLIPGGMLISVKSEKVTWLSATLGLDPWQRFTPGWAGRYLGQNTGSQVRWTYARDVGLEIRTDQILSVSSFTDSLAASSRIENPNMDYGEGHFLPFPLAVVRAGGTDSFWLSLELLDPIENNP